MTPFSTRLSLLVAVLLVVALTTKGCSAKVGKDRREIRNSLPRSPYARPRYNEPVPLHSSKAVKLIKPVANSFTSSRVGIPLVHKSAEAHKPTYRSQQNSINAHNATYHHGGQVPDYTPYPWVYYPEEPFPYFNQVGQDPDYSYYPWAYYPEEPFPYFNQVGQDPDYSYYPWFDYPEEPFPYFNQVPYGAPYYPQWPVGGDLPAGGALPAGDVYYPQAPQESASDLGLGTDLGAILGHALTPTHTRVVKSSNSYSGGGGGGGGATTPVAPEAPVAPVTPGPAVAPNPTDQNAPVPPGPAPGSQPIKLRTVAYVF
ncbi:uncharacterized protein LOC113564099 [Drosophila erecta]|uniref:uncharacterized protein LOC113564080 n=1 Tax=Drosophila erecta TaxID=7220 RepID=UPI000F0602C2|nr:uncharacterized protein LOC113564080 [Drosophila erecta]XP_026834774.1 uncharacterized protein LOC113564099 [Drosophila erecta]